MKPLAIADLFCGAGGTSTGALEAIRALGFEPQLTAINHWSVAIATHTANHPGARHLCTTIDNIDPKTLFGEGELQILWASPECTHHSVARGGKPINDQSRATAWCVVRWAEALRPNIILVENVPEFETWGAIGSNGRPMKTKRGATFLAWVGSLESLGYTVDWRVLCAADYGDPTTRRRLFIQAVRGRRRVVWPEPTHAPVGNTDMYGHTRKAWVAAREIIDWSMPGQSIYERKRPLSPKTMRRIMAGLEKFGLKPFIIPQETGEGRVNSVEKPLHTVTAGGRSIALAEPFILSAGGPECAARSVSQPIGTVLTRDHRALVQPFIVTMEHGGSERSADRPLPTITTAKGGAMGVAEPFLVRVSGTEDRRPRSIGEPLQTVTAGGISHGVAQPFLIEMRGTSDQQIANTSRSVESPMGTVTAGGIHHGLAEPFLIHMAHSNERRPRSIQEPMPAVAGNRGDVALVEPSLLPQNAGGALRPVSQPVPTVATDGAIGLIEPFLVEYYGTGDAQSVGAPLNTVTTKDRHALVRPVVVIAGERYLLDIRFRMLQPKELAAAQGFRRDYQFTGTKSDQVKQIGNAVPRNLARAICLAALGQQPNIAHHLRAEDAA
jgi:DNA (cytosine-5)-methyltransferase 1